VYYVNSRAFPDERPERREERWSSGVVAGLWRRRRRISASPRRRRGIAAEGSTGTGGDINTLLSSGCLFTLSLPNHYSTVQIRQTDITRTPYYHQPQPQPIY
jgi:hypothetical protein